MNWFRFLDSLYYSNFSTTTLLLLLGQLLLAFFGINTLNSRERLAIDGYPGPTLMCKWLTLQRGLLEIAGVMRFLGGDLGKLRLRIDIVHVTIEGVALLNKLTDDHGM